MLIKQTIILLIIATFLSLFVNLFSPNKIDYIGKYRSLSSGDGPIIPPNAQAGDPPFIAIDVAELEYSLGKTVFIDAREPEEFECGTISRAINIPFDYLPEDNIETYIDSSLGGVSKDYPMIIFCSGDECDLSLHLGRNLQDINYSNISIFYGGWREWEKFGLEVQRRQQCED